MEEQTQERTARSRVYVDGQAFWTWVDHEVLPQFDSLNELTRVLAERAAIRATSLHRQILRLRSRPRIEFFALDRLCTLLGEHVSRFCDLSQFEGAK